MTRQVDTAAGILSLTLLAGLATGVNGAQRLITGQCAGAGGAGSGRGLKLVGSIPASAAGRSSGGSYRVTGGFIAAAQMVGDSDSGGDVVAGAASGLVSALTAVPTADGAQITFTLSSAATVRVRVLNIAGRVIRTVTPERECPAGLTTLVWSGVSDGGLRTPNGVYVVEVVARSEGGAQARGITPVQVAR